MKLHRILAAVLVFGVMTLWVRDVWAVALLQTAVFLCTCFVLVADVVRRRYWWPAPIVAIPAAIFGLGCVQLATHVTVWPSATRAAILYWLAATCLVFLGQKSCATPETRDHFLKTALAAGSLVCLLGIVQLFTSNGLVLWYFQSGYDTRVIGPFASPNNYAAFVQLLLPVALALGLRRGNSYPWLIVAASLFASVLASASRAGAALAVLEVAVVFLLSRSQVRQNTGARRALLIFTSLAVVFTLVVGYQFMWQRFSELDDPLALRRQFLQSSFAMVRAQPLQGFGLGTWTAVYPQFAIIDPGVVANHAHNEWVQWAAEGGLPVFALMAAVLAWTVRPAVCTVWGIGVLSVFLHALVDYPFMRLGLAAWIFVLLGAMAAWVQEHSRRRPSSSTNRIPAVGLALILFAAAFLSIRSAWADVLFRQATPESVQQAAIIEPDHAEYHAALAQIDTDRAIEHLERALSVNPYLTGARITLAGHMEARRDYHQAEDLLLEAARRDHLYTPAWALANFYFRTQDPRKFWEWARRAAAMAYGDISPLFDLCFAMADDAEVVRNGLGGGSSITRQLLHYGMMRRPAIDLSAQARSLAAAAVAEDRPVLLDYIDRSLVAGRTDAAAEVWRLLAAKKLVAGWNGPESLLSNSDFRDAITGRGFDWRAHPVDGIAAKRQVAEGAPVLAVRLSGRQAENCEVISQFVRLQRGSTYVVQFDYRTENLPADTGLSWSVGGAPALALKASTGWTTGRGEFPVTRPSDRLVLRYARVPGTTRAEGALLLRNVRLAQQPTKQSAHALR